MAQHQRLALLGGPKSVTAPVGNTKPVVGEEEASVAAELIRRREISHSPVTQELEREFAQYIGVEHALACNNGTATLHAALYGVGVGAGDEVIVSSVSYWASSVPPVLWGAVPVFADVDKETANLDPADIERKITPRTKAIIVVHVWGNPAPMDEIMAIADRHGIKVIEDCSHAHGATYKGRKVGSIGHVGCFSLQAAKLVTGGEGGILTTNDISILERAIALGHYERLERFPALPPDSEFRKYGMTGLGLKFRIHPVSAGIALCQLRKLETVLEARRHNGEAFIAGVEGIGLRVQAAEPQSAPTYYDLHGHWPEVREAGISQDLLIRALQAEGVAIRETTYGTLHYEPLFQNQSIVNPAFEQPAHVRYERGTLPNSEYIHNEYMSLMPIFCEKNDLYVEQTVNAYRKVYAQLDALREYAKGQSA